MKGLAKNILQFVISIAIPLGVGFLSSLLIRDSFGIYQTLIKPFFAPPGWIFGPVWTILYILMGVASYRIWRSRRNKGSLYGALSCYGFQLLLNFLWPILFFRFEMRFVAWIEIVVLLLAIIITTRKFYRLDKIAGDLMLPYILWVSYATLLNFSIWLLN